MPKNRRNGSRNRRPQAAKVRRDSQGRSSARSYRGRQRHLSVRGELRETPDVQKIARAVIAMAMAQAEADAQAAAATKPDDSDGGKAAGSEVPE